MTTELDMNKLRAVIRDGAFPAFYVLDEPEVWRSIGAWRAILAEWRWRVNARKADT